MCAKQLTQTPLVEHRHVYAALIRHSASPGRCLAFFFCTPLVSTIRRPCLEEPMDSHARGQEYLKNVTGKLNEIEKSEAGNIRRAGEMIADAYAQDRLIHVYGGGGHTVMMVCEMFFRAGGLANVNPIF